MIRNDSRHKEPYFSCISCDNTRQIARLTPAVPVLLSLHTRRNSLYARSSLQPRKKLRQPHEILDTETAATTTDKENRIGRHDVGPACRKAHQLASFVVEIDPLLSPRMPILDQPVLLPEARMERVRYVENPRRIPPMTCS